MTRNEIFHLYRASALSGLISSIGGSKDPHLGMIRLSNLYALEMLALIPEGYEPDIFEEVSNNVPEITIRKSDGRSSGQSDSPVSVVVDPTDKSTGRRGRPAGRGKSK